MVSVVDDWWGGRHIADMLPRLVRAVTSPVNTGSIGFHQRMGFDIEPGHTQVGGVPVTAAYDGDTQDRVQFVKHLAR